ncbi:MAG: SurA N-terminal domain-containing protein [Cyclobacteriaceae bacterium]
MALINTLRNKMGKVVVGVIAFSIISFIGADLLGPNSVLLGGTNTDVGEIAGVTISRDDFIAKVDEVSFNFRSSTGRNPSSSELISLRNQAWDALIADIAYKEQFDMLGVEVSEDELVDMVQGENISPQIKQVPIFTNQQTGQFDRNLVVEFLKSLSNQPPQQRAAWYQFESNLGPGRRRLKYENLLIKTNYATEEEAKQEYNMTAATADIQYLYVPYYTLKDSAVSVTESELEDYLESHQDEYQREDTRSMKYVTFEVIPSAGDTAIVKKEIQGLKEGFIKAENDSIFAVVNSDGSLPFITYRADNVPESLFENEELVPEGTVVGPELENGKYVLYKLAKVSEGLQYSAKASHILFKPENDTPAAKSKTKEEARKILREIRNGADFAEMARIHGTDGTATRGGDLGWFNEGQMVAPFQEAVFKATSKGLLRDVVETEFGYHIIDVTELKTNIQYKVGKIELEIYVSDQTRNKFYREAELFSVKAKNLSEFEKNSAEAGLEIKTAERIGKNDRRIGSLNEARGIVSWLYNTASKGDVSEIYEIDNFYVIAAMTGKQDKGAANLNVVRNEISRKVRDQKKAQVIIDKLSPADGQLQEIADNYGSDAKVYTMNGLKLSSNSLNSVGLAPEAVGVAFSMENGEKTKPFALDNGVIIIELTNKIEPAEIADYVPYQGQVQQKRQSRISFNIDATVKELADIQDERYRFF